jgi:hypothetical protein
VVRPSNALVYMGVTAHIFSPDMRPESWLLDISSFTGSHTGDKIGNHCVSLVDDFDIRPKLAYIVTDNAANMQGWARDRDVSVSRRLETHPGSRLGLVSNRTANVSVSSRSRRPTSRVSSRSRAQTSRSRLGLEILGLEPIPG